MAHPKTLYTYVGVDSHKDTHTAALIDCFFETLGVISFDNRPSKFEAFLSQAEGLKADGTALMFGLEDASAYGRQLAAFLNGRGHQVRHVTAYLVARERKNQNITQKSDAGDALCAARVLLSKFGELPSVEPDDRYWTLRAMVTRRDFLVKNNVALKNYLHNILAARFPRYSDFFSDIFCKSALAFFEGFPSPAALDGVTVGELAGFLKTPSYGQFGAKKAADILATVKESGHMDSLFQDAHDGAVRSTIRQIRYNLQEIESAEGELAVFLEGFGCTLTSMTGIDTVTAAQMLSCIGDIRKFATPAKLARYSGVAPVAYSSGKTDAHYANRRGNRELNSIFYRLAVRLVSTVNPSGKAVNPFFYEYYHRKQSEGKTKRQALKCVQRRLVNIIWTMLTRNEEYVNPPMLVVGRDKGAT